MSTVQAALPCGVRDEVGMVSSAIASITGGLPTQCPGETVGLTERSPSRMDADRQFPVAPPDRSNETDERSSSTRDTPELATTGGCSRSE